MLRWGGPSELCFSSIRRFCMTFKDFQRALVVLGLFLILLYLLGQPSLADFLAEIETRVGW